MRGSRLWRWKKPKAGLAFTGEAIVAFKTGASRRIERRDLPQGLVAVSPTALNVSSERDLAEIAEGVLAAVGVRREALAVALPDLAVTTAVLKDKGRASERELLKELSPRLPYSIAEARYDFFRGRYDEVLAASIRDAVAHQYEQIVEAVECRLAWVDAVSLARVPSLSGSHGLDVDLQLYRDHYAMTVIRDGELVDVRTKLRAAGDVEALCREVLRVPALHGGDSIDTLCLLGADAPVVGAELEGVPAVGAIRIENDDEDRQLQSAIETLLARGNP